MHINTCVYTPPPDSVSYSYGASQHYMQSYVGLANDYYSKLREDGWAEASPSTVHEEPPWPAAQADEKRDVYIDIAVLCALLGFFCGWYPPLRGAFWVVGIFASPAACFWMAFSLVFLWSFAIIRAGVGVLVACLGFARCDSSSGATFSDERALVVIAGLSMCPFLPAFFTLCFVWVKALALGFDFMLAYLYAVVRTMQRAACPQCCTPHNSASLYRRSLVRDHIMAPRRSALPRLSASP